MVKVEFFRDRMGFQAMKLTGHAEYNPGQDVVCAGISALAFALVGTLQGMKASFRRRKVDVGVDIEIEPFIYPDDQAVADAVFMTCLTGLRMIEAAHPAHIDIREVIL